jgi:hypothetical protein
VRSEFAVSVATNVVAGPIGPAIYTAMVSDGDIDDGRADKGDGDERFDRGGWGSEEGRRWPS